MASHPHYDGAGPLDNHPGPRLILRSSGDGGSLRIDLFRASSTRLFRVCLSPITPTTTHRQWIWQTATNRCQRKVEDLGSVT